MKSKHYLALIILQISLFSFSQTVKYRYRALHEDGCTVIFGITKKDSTYILTSSVKSLGLTLLKEPAILIKTFKNNIITLNGELINNNSSSVGIMFDNFIIPIIENTTIAQFKIKEEYLELFKEGVAKIRITTIPSTHERTFKKDKIGMKLYNAYMNTKNETENF